MAVAEYGSVDIGSLTSFVAQVDVTSLPDDALSRLVVEGEMALNAVHVLSAAALAEFDRRGGRASDGSLSAAGWAAARTGSPTRALSARVRAGMGLRLLPAAETAARRGRLSPAHVAALAGCARRHPDLATRDETMLVEQAETLGAEAFTAAARHWQERASAVESPDPGALDRPEPVDELHLSRTLDGRYQLDGSFSAETGEIVHAALQGQVGPPAAGRPRRRPIRAGRRFPGAGRRAGRPGGPDHAPRAVGGVGAGPVPGRCGGRPRHGRVADDVLRRSRQDPPDRPSVHPLLHTAA